MSLRIRCPNRLNTPNGPDSLTGQMPQRARCPFEPDAPTCQMSFRTIWSLGLNHIHGKMNIHSARNTDRFTWILPKTCQHLINVDFCDKNNFFFISLNISIPRIFFVAPKYFISNSELESFLAYGCVTHLLCSYQHVIHIEHQMYHPSTTSASNTLMEVCLTTGEKISM